MVGAKKEPSRHPRHLHDRLLGVGAGEEGQGEGALEVLSKPLEMEKLLELLEDSPHRSILLVDDDRAFTETLKSFLESNSFKVAIAHSAEEAIDIFGEDPSRSVILDMKLDAGSTGLDVFVAFKELNPTVLGNPDNRLPGGDERVGGNGHQQ